MSSQKLRKQGIGMVIALVIQYALGMAANLFSKFPQSTSVNQLWEYAWSQFFIYAHIIVAILLLIGAIVFVIKSARSGDRIWIICSLIGLIAIILAGLSGATFITTQMDIYSYSMSLFFIVALISYFIGIIKSKTDFQKR